MAKRDCGSNPYAERAHDRRKKNLTVAGCAAAGGFEQDCRVCRKIPQTIRDRWGCDADASSPFAFLACPECLGGDASCPICGGDPQGFAVTRCPNRTIGRPEMMVAESRHLMEVGILPTHGGLLDQSITWWRAVKILASEYHATIERRRAQKE